MFNCYFIFQFYLILHALFNKSGKDKYLVIFFK